MNKPELPSMVSTQAEIEAVSGDASEFEKTFPDHIWLDVGEASQFAEPLEKFSDLQEVTWSEDNATGYGVKYVRVDLASQASLAKRGTEPSDEQIDKLIAASAGGCYREYDHSDVCAIVRSVLAESALSQEAMKDEYRKGFIDGQIYMRASMQAEAPHVPAGQGEQ